MRLGYVNNKGYARVSIAGRSMYAHRAMYEQEVGPVPDGMQLDHLCRVRNCINPQHLQPVTHAENLQRGRGVKLTPEQAQEIRSAPQGVETKELAATYGISESHASRVRRGLKYHSV